MAINSKTPVIEMGVFLHY